VAGAVEGTILGIPSFALSQAYMSRSAQPPHWDTAAKFAPDIIRRSLAAGIPHDVLININFPNCAPGEVKGIGVAQQGRNKTERLQIESRQDGRGNSYYWIMYVRQRAQPPVDGTDISALAANRIAVTPLRLDMTDEPFAALAGRAPVGAYPLVAECSIRSGLELGKLFSVPARVAIGLRACDVRRSRWRTRTRRGRRGPRPPGRSAGHRD
jgi:hypothetical protein